VHAQTAVVPVHQLFDEFIAYSLLAFPHRHDLLAKQSPMVVILFILP
jgi:hypothetical protein